MLKGILLDIDGTLTLSNEFHARAWKESFGKFGYEIPLRRIRKLMGMGGDKLIPELFPEMTSKKGIGKEIVEYRKSIFLQKYANSVRSTPGARKLIQEFLNEKLKLVVATSAHEDELHVLLKAGGVEDLIKVYTSSSDVVQTKPAPDIIEVALGAIDLKAEDVVMIGDSPFDIQSAAQRSVRVIALRTGGFTDDELKGAYAIFEDPNGMLHQWRKIKEALNN